MPRRRRPGRLLAPAALVAAVTAILVIVAGGDEPQPGSTEATPRTEDERPARRARRTTLVRRGDTLSEVAERTNVPVQTLLDLNPELDPQTLQRGQRLRIRE